MLGGGQDKISQKCLTIKYLNAVYTQYIKGGCPEGIRGARYNDANSCQLL